ncbi:MAG: hypothetical protein ACE15E_09060 [Acidobacteriota bacterium]
MSFLLGSRAYLLVLWVVVFAGTVVAAADPDTLVFAQIGGGGGLVSEIVLVNPFQENPVEGRIDFYADSGAPLLLPIAEAGSEEPISGFTYNLPPSGSVTLSTRPEGETQVGCAVATSTGPLTGVVRFRIPGIGVAGVGPSEVSPAFVVPVRQQGDIGTGVAVHNPGPEPVNLQLTLRDTGGRLVAESTVEAFPGRGHLAQYVSEMCPEARDFEGTLTVEASGGNVSGTAIELGSQPGQLTTLPVTRLEAAAAQEPGRLYFAQIGGAAGLSSSVVLVNPHRERVVSGRLQLLDDDGKPLEVGMEGEPVSDISFSVAPLGATTLTTDAVGPLKVGSASVEADGVLGGVVRYQTEGLGTAAVPQSHPTNAAIVPVRIAAGLGSTGIAVRNVGESPLNLDLTLRDQAGNVVPGGRATLSDLAAGAHVARYVTELFPCATRDGVVGTLSLESKGGSFASTSLEIGLKAGEFTAMPAARLLGEAPYYPLLVPPKVPGTVYYVNSDTGSDTNDGLTPTTAFKTLKRGVAALSPAGGDELVIEGVFRETLDIGNKNRVAGDPNRPTVVRAAVDECGRKKLAMIDGGIPPAASSFPYDKRGLPPGFGPGQGGYLTRGIIINQSQYVWIDGLHMRGVAGLGVLTWLSHHVTLHDVTVEWTTESALMLPNGQVTDPKARDLKVVNCRVNQSNLGGYENKSTYSGYNMKSETVSIVRWDGFYVAGNHISNSLMEGIDFKEGSRNGEICYNLVENTRKVAFYANEGVETTIHHNVARRVGWYDPEDGTGLKRASVYLGNYFGGLPESERGANGFLIQNGDLLGGPLESGKVYGIDVHHNLVCHVVGDGLSMYNEWAWEGKTGWRLDNIRIFNNTFYDVARASHRASGIQGDVNSSDIQVANNIVVGSRQRGGDVWNEQQGSFTPKNSWTNTSYFNNSQNGYTGANPVFADPLFVDVPEELTENGDLSLQAGSPAVDAGVDVGLPFKGAAPDLGAFERGEPIWRVGPHPERQYSLKGR